MMVHFGHLFPQEFKKEGCSDCSDVLLELMKIEERFKLLKGEINGRNCVQHNGEYKITCLYAAISWKWNMVMYLYSLLLKLKPQEVETEFRDAISELTKVTQETEKRVSEFLGSRGISCDVSEGYVDKLENLRFPVAVMANSGNHCYDDTAFEKTAHGLIKEIADMDEKLHAATNEKAIDKIGILKSQFELAKLLPSPPQVEDEITKNLFPEVTVLRGHKFTYRECTDIVSRVHYDMEATSRDMLKLASGIGEMRHKGDQGEKKCSVKDTLDSLLEKANSFIERWDKNYATYFGELDDGTILKRQRL